jgi:hypothetical protein
LDIFVIHEPLMIFVVFEDKTRIPGGTVRSPQHRGTCQLRGALREQHVGIRLGERVVDGTRTGRARFEVRIRFRVGISQGLSFRGKVVVRPRVVVTVRGITPRVVARVIITAGVATIAVLTVITGVTVVPGVSAISISSVIPRVMIVRFLGSTVVPLGPLVAITLVV